jgi:hypothetical protein
MSIAKAMNPSSAAKPAAVMKRVIPLSEPERSKFRGSRSFRFVGLMSFPPRVFWLNADIILSARVGRWRVSGFIGITKGFLKVLF